MSSIKPTIPKGTRDFSPLVMARREFIFDTLKKIFKKYGYQPLETPAMEQLSVLTGKYGEEGDRLIFKVLNSGDFLGEFKTEDELNQSLKKGAGSFAFKISEKALRYDLTVPFARYVVMNHGELNFPFKRYQVQPVWRADRPQKGRYREFYQCDADVVGSDSLIYEAELIALYAEAFHLLGLSSIRIDVNHRMILNALAAKAGQPEKVAELCMAIDKLDKIGKDGVSKELIQRGFSEENLPAVFRFLDLQGTNEELLNLLADEIQGIEAGETGLKELTEVFRHLHYFDTKNAEVQLNFSLARGLDYYTGTILEVKPLGVQMGSIGGGGRYADLTGIFGLKGVPGVGISFGADRIYDVMEELKLFSDEAASNVKVMVVFFGEETSSHSIKALQALRNAGIPSEMYPEAAKLGKQFKFAEKKGIHFVLMIGTEEAKSGKANLKDLRDSSQELLSIEEVIQKLS